MSYSSYLAFDLGASSGRAVLGSLDETHLEIEEVHRFDAPLRERGEHLYWDLEELERQVRRGLEIARERVSALRSCSVDSWGVDYVPLDEEGAPVRDAYAYRDPRTEGMMERAFERVDPEEIYRVTGIQFMPINTIYQVLADRLREPELFERTALRVPIADFLNHRLGGRPVAEVSLASTTQLLDVSRREWARPLMQRLELDPDGWPDVVPSGTRIGNLSDRPETSVIAGCSHDTACAVAGIPAEEGVEWAFLSCGTWSLLGAERDRPVLTEAAREANFTNEIGRDGTIRFLKNLTGLWVLQECERAWREEGRTFDYETLTEEARAAAPGTGSDASVDRGRGPEERLIDLNADPFGRPGEMERKIREACRAEGYDPPETRGEIVRCILASLAEMHRLTLRRLEALTGTTYGVLHVVGGGARNELLCQWTADACGCPVVAGPAEATAAGNLLVQARTMSDLPASATVRDVVRRSTELTRYRPRSVG